MPVDPGVNLKIDALIADLRSKEQSFAVASDANDVAQTAAQAAAASAASALSTKVSAHDDLSASIDALVTFVSALKG
jgi:uncharacterized membrane-anchored protein